MALETLKGVKKIKALRWVEGGLEVVCNACGLVFVAKDWSGPVDCQVCKEKPAVTGDEPAGVTTCPSEDNNFSDDGGKT